VHKLEKKNVVFTKDGAKVGVKEISAEKYADKTQRAFVNTWNAAQDGYVGGVGRCGDGAERRWTDVIQVDGEATIKAVFAHTCCLRATRTPGSAIEIWRFGDFPLLQASHGNFLGYLDRGRKGFGWLLGDTSMNGNKIPWSFIGRGTLFAKLRRRVRM
tara:strand:+ start:26806 stop:27279 length:474 start_codon:yes stop_codon:yes gene_type:complete